MAENNLTKILSYIISIAEGNCKITDEIIVSEKDDLIKEILTGLLYLFEDLELSKSELIEMNSNLEKKVLERSAELKLVNSKIQYNESKFSAFFENTVIGMIMDTPEGIHTLANEAIHRMLGYDFEKRELIGKHFLDITVPEDREKSIVGVEKLIKNEANGLQLTKRYFTKDEQIVWAKTTVSCIKDDKGKVVKLIIFIEDLTKRRSVEEERNRLFNNSNNLICTINTKGYFENINPAFTRTLGFSKKKLLSTQWIDFLHPDDIKLALREINSLNNSRLNINFQSRALCSDGEYIWLSWSINLDSVSQNLFATARDVTKKKLYEVKLKKRTAELKRSNQELKQFSYMTSHDLKVPIMNLEGYFLFLKDEVDKENKDLMDTVHWIGKSIEQAKTTIQNITIVNQFQNRKIKAENINLFEILTSTLDLFKSDIESLNICFTIDFKKCSDILYDTVVVRSIFQNLISNGIKYHSPERIPHISISTYKTPGYNCISFKDNGLGIDLTKNSNTLFDLFKRIHDHVEGSGIGLYMIKKILDDNGGKIEVESELGQGSEFIIYLKTL